MTTLPSAGTVAAITERTRVTLSTRDYVVQIVFLVSIVGGGAFWINSKLADQRAADVAQDARIAQIETGMRRSESDSQALNAALVKLGDRLDGVTNKLSEISTGVARIDERTRKNTP